MATDATRKHAPLFPTFRDRATSQNPLIAYWKKHYTRISTKAHTLMMTLLTGALAAIMGTVIVRILSALSQIWIAHRFDVASYGQYSTIATVLTLVSGLIALGLDTWILQEGARNEDALPQLVWQVLLVKVASVAVLLIAFATVWSSTVTKYQAFYIGLVAVVFESFALTGYAALRVKRRNVLVAGLQLISPVMLLAALWLIRDSELTVSFLFITQVICSLFPALFLFFIVRNICGRFHVVYSIPYMVNQVWVFVASDILSTIYAQVPIAMLAMHTNDTTVGIFKPTLDVLRFANIVPLMLFFVGLPLLGSSKTSRDKQYKLMLAMLGAVLVYGLVAMIGLRFGSGFAISVLNGKQYIAAAPFLQQMAIIPLIKSASIICSAFIIARDRQIIRIILQIVAMVASLYWGLTMIPTQGIFGAVWLVNMTNYMIFVFYAGISLYIIIRDIRQPEKMVRDE